MRQYHLMDMDAGWDMDKKNSIARLTIYPIRRGDESFFRYSYAIEIKPYPNPFMFGGEWGNGGVKTEADIKQVEADFRKKITAWVKRGIKVEITRKPEERLPLIAGQMRM